MRNVTAQNRLTEVFHLPAGSAVFASTHPDATAFAARFLANPEDRLGRLVFADWLEERGRESNLAWAQYLRLMAEAEEESDSDIIRRAEAVGRVVRARLTLGRVPGTPLLTRLTAFLPDHRIWQRIGEGRIPRSVIELCPESVIREHQSMPVEHDRGTLFFVTAFPRVELDRIRWLFELIHNRRVVLFRGEVGDVIRALNNHYGGPDVQFVLELPDTPGIEAG